MAESLCYSPETITRLLIGYTLVIFLGRNAAEAPALWPPDSKN